MSMRSSTINSSKNLQHTGNVAGINREGACGMCERLRQRLCLAPRPRSKNTLSGSRVYLETGMIHIYEA